MKYTSASWSVLIMYNMFNFPKFICFVNLNLGVPKELCSKIFEKPIIFVLLDCFLLGTFESMSCTYNKGKMKHHAY